MSEDWLWFYLKRLPPDQALVEAQVARLFAAGQHLSVGEAQGDHPTERRLLDWRTTRSSPTAPAAYDLALVDARQTPLSAAEWQQLHQALSLDGRLVLITPADTPAETWAAQLGQAGFVITQWQPFLSEAAQATIASLDTRWHQLSYALTGHYVLRPWQRVLAPLEQRLRPWYTEAMPEQGRYLYLTAHKAGDEPIPPLLPPPRVSETLEVLPAPLPAITPPVATPITTDATEPGAPANESDTASLWPGYLAWLLIAVTVVAAFAGQAALRANPTQPAAGLRWLGLALAGLLGLRWWIDRGDQPATPKRRWQWPAVPALRWLYLGCLLLALLASVLDSRPALALLLWVAAGVGAFYVLGGAPSPIPAGSVPPPAGPAPVQTRLYHALVAIPRTSWLAWGIVGVALALRLVSLTTHPFMLNGSEASLALEAWRVTLGQVRDPFSTGWLAHPTLPLFLTALPVQGLGRTVLAARLLSPLVGALTVWAIYVFGRRLWNPTVGLISAILLAGAHLHLHYSRLGLTNIWDPLLLLLAVGGVAVAWSAPTRRAWLLAGAAIGLNVYFFTASRLLPLILIGLMGVTVGQGAAWRAQARHILAATLLALVLALPQLLHYQSHPGLFMERAEALAIHRNGWLAQEAAQRQVSQATILGEQFTAAALGFTATLDRDTSYNPGIPFLGAVTSAFFYLGVGMALFHFRNLAYGGPLIWLLVTVLFGGALLLEPPHSRRLLAALPAVYLLAGRALYWLSEKGFAVSAPSLSAGQRTALFQRYGVGLLLSLALVVAGADAAFYFGRYRAEHRFGDRNTEIAYVMSNYLNSLEGEWSAYFYGPPSMYVGFSTLTYLATDFEANLNLFDVITFADRPRAPTSQVVHIFLPERLEELSAVQAEWPAGDLRTFQGYLASPLFVAYEVRP